MQQKYLGIAFGLALALTASTAFAATTTDYVNYWSFDEGTGRVAADSVGGKNGTLVGTSTSFGWASGQSGTALGMDGAAGTGVGLPANAFPASPGTLAVWFKFAGLTDQNVIVSGSAIGESQVYMNMFVDYQGRLTVKYRTSFGGTERTANISKILNPNEWYHLVWIGDGVAYTAYINGEKFDVLGNNTGKWIGSLNSGYVSQYTIGAASVPYAAAFSGYLDEFKVYNRALSAEEVAMLYNNGNAGTPQLPVALRPAPVPQVPVTEVTLVGTTTTAATSTTMTVATSTKPTPPGLLIAAWKRSLGVGSSGQDVTNLQLFLIRHGLLAEGNAIGYFGPRTKAAVIKFQTQNGIPGTGYFGPLTRAKVTVMNK